MFETFEQVLMRLVRLGSECMEGELPFSVDKGRERGGKKEQVWEWEEMREVPTTGIQSE